MAIIYTYPIVIPTSNDLVLGTDVDAKGKPTKNFTIQSIIDLVTVSGNDLQAVLNNGNSATQNIILTGNISATQYTDGTMSIVGGVGTGFSSITSTDFAGNLTGIVKAGSSIEGTVTGVTQNQGDNSTKLATTAYVDGQVDPSVLQYLGDSTGPFDLNLVNDDFKITGTANQIETTATAVAGNVGTITLKFPTAGVTLPDGSVATTQAASDDSTKVATTAFVRNYDDLQDLDFTTGSGSGSVLLNSQSLTLAGTSNQITTSGSGQTATFALTSSVTISGTYTGTTFAGDLLGTVNTATTGTTQSAGDNSTKIATTAYVDNAAGAKTLDYAGDATGTFALNLSTDDLEFNGDSNISVSAAAVVANKGIITIDLNNNVGISGVMTADNFTDGTFTGGVGTYTGYTSITSAAFVGPLTGNANTATALASSGAIALTGDTTSTGGPYTYTSGGPISIATTIADTTVTGKVLTNLPTPTSAAIAASDTILAAMAKLQGQITGIAGSLAFEGTWDARTVGEGGAGTPPSATPVNGQFWIVEPAGSQDLDGITDWLVGDWAIYVSNGAGTDAWQKLDQSNEVLGSGAADKIAKWTSANTLATGLISDDGATVTIGNNGNLTVQGNTILGDADTDTTTVKGPAHFEETLRADVGIGLGGATYGSSGQVLTSGGGAASVNTWTTPTVGEVVSITGNYGITIGGTAAIPTVAITDDADNLINQATSKNTPIGADSILINDSAATNVLKKSTISSLPFDNFAGWVLSDGTNTTTITTGATASFAGGTYITTGEASGTLTITHDATTRTSGTSTDTPAFGATVTMFDDVQTNGTGHVTTTNLKTVTLPSPVNFTAGSAPGATAAVGTAGYVPAPAAGTGSTAYFLNGTGVMSIPPDLKGVETVNTTTPIEGGGSSATVTISHKAVLTDAGGTAGTYDSVTVDGNGHVTAGVEHNGGRKSALIEINAAAMSTTNWVDMFTISATQGNTIISNVMASGGLYGSITKGQAMSYHVAQQGGTAGTTTANAPVYNKIIDTGPGTAGGFELQFIAYGAGGNAFGYKCQAKSTTATQNINISVEIIDGTARQTGSNYPTITDLT